MSSSVSRLLKNHSRRSFVSKNHGCREDKRAMEYGTKTAQEMCLLRSTINSNIKLLPIGWPVLTTSIRILRAGNFLSSSLPNSSPRSVFSRLAVLAMISPWILLSAQVYCSLLCCLCAGSNSRSDKISGWLLEASSASNKQAANLSSIIVAWPHSVS